MPLQGESQSLPKCRLSRWGHLLESASCTCPDKSRRTSKPKFLGVSDRWWFRVPLLYGWLWELGSCLHRICALNELRNVQTFGLDYGPLPMFEEVGTDTLILCKRTLSCIEDIQRLTQTRPWASLQDLQLYLDGWKRGAESALSESRSPRTSQSQPPDQCS